MGGTNHFTIFLGGDCFPTKRLRAEIADTTAIAADGGMRHAAAFGITPVLWVGDFDSTHAALAERFPHVPRDEHPTAKDATDGEIAIRAALARGATKLTILGAFGGDRVDHELGTIGLALALADRAEMALTDGKQWGYPLIDGGELTVQATPGSTLSVIGWNDLSGLTIEGVRWPLRNEMVPFGSSRTLSNEITDGGHARLTLRRGRALVVVHGQA